MICDFELCADLEVTKVRKLVCDRCGREIDQGFVNKYDMRPKAYCHIFDDHYPSLSEESGDLEYDLCEDCTNQLVTFLKG